MYTTKVAKVWCITNKHTIKKKISIMLLNEVRATTTRIMIYMAYLDYIRWLFICDLQPINIYTSTFTLFIAVDICHMFVLWSWVPLWFPQTGDTQSIKPRGSLGNSPSRRHTINYTQGFRREFQTRRHTINYYQGLPWKFLKQEIHIQWITNQFIQR